MNPTEELHEIMTRLGLNCTEAGAVAGCSGNTVKLAIASGLLPKTVRARDAILRFITANRSVTTRSELRFVA